MTIGCYRCRAEREPERCVEARVLNTSIVCADEDVEPKCVRRTAMYGRNRLIDDYMHGGIGTRVLIPCSVC